MGNKIRMGRLDLEMSKEKAAQPDNKYLKISEVGERLSISSMTVYRLVQSGDLPAIRVGKTIRIHPKDLRNYIEKKTAAYRDEAGNL